MEGVGGGDKKGEIEETPPDCTHLGETYHSIFKVVIEPYYHTTVVVLLQFPVVCV